MAALFPEDLPPPVIKSRPQGSMLVVLYGSQTGNAEEVAERVVRLSMRRNIPTNLYCMDDTDFSYGFPWSEDAVLCFVCSTTGQGNEPDNMKNFWRYLRKKSLDSNFFRKIPFGVLGLGDSSYSQYNVVAKKLFRRIEQLGGIPLVELGLADEQHDLGSDAFVDPWVENFSRQAFSKLRGLPEPIGEAPLEPKFTLICEQVRSMDALGIKPNLPHPFPVKNHPVEVHKIVKKERMTGESHFQDVKLITFDLEDSALTYEPGDVLMIQPSNLEEYVELFFRIFPQLSSRRTEKFFLYPNPKRPWVKIPAQLERLHPQPWSLYELVKHYFDLQAIPKRYLFELMSYFTSDDLEREGLQDLASPKGQENLYKYCNRPKRTVLEVLQDFPHTTENIPEDYLFDLMGPIKPRAFSIAGGSKKEGRKEVEILMAVVSYKTILKEPRQGLCSNWLNRLDVGAEVPIWIEEGSFEFPQKGHATPIIMVGPGTGVAPFRCLSVNYPFAYKLVLFFGCRYETKDFYFENEFKSLQENKGLLLFTAFSRDNPDVGKIYVQQRIAEQARLICDLVVNEGAYIFVAGNAKQMPIAVAAAFRAAIEAMGIEDPAGFMHQLERDGKYQTEVWS